MKKHMLKRISVIMILFLCATFFISCSKKDSGAQSGKAPQKQTIKLVHYMGEQTKRDGLDALISAYKAKKPNVDFDVQAISSAQYITIYKTRIQANDAPDLFFGKPRTLKEFVDGNHFMDLTGQPFLNNLLPLLVDECSVNGKVYGVPLDAQVKGVFYNKNMFEQNGLKVPATRDEFIKVLDAFAAKQIFPLIHTYNFIHGPFHQLDTIYTSMAVAKKMPNGWEDSQTGKAELEGNQVVSDSISLVSKLASYKDNGDAAIDQVQGIQNFAAEKRPMYINGGWIMGDVSAANPNTQFGIFPTPWSNKADENKLWIGIDDVFIVSAKTDKKDAVLDFLSFITSAEQAAVWMDKAKLMPSNTGVDVSKGDSFIKEIKTYIDGNKIVAKSLVPDYTAEYSNAFRTKLQLFVTLPDKDRSVEKFIKELDKEIESIRK